MTEDLFKGEGKLVSDCGHYQYARWFERRGMPHGNGQTVTIIGLNPVETAGDDLDSTTEVCVEFGEKQGFEKIILVNLFAVMSQNQDGVPIGKDPVGPETDRWILAACAQSDLILVAWGDYPRIGQRVNRLMNLLKPFDLFCIQANRNGSPTHPLAWKLKSPKIYRAKVQGALPEAG